MLVCEWPLITVSMSIEFPSECLCRLPILDLTCSPIRLVDGGVNGRDWPGSTRTPHSDPPRDLTKSSMVLSALLERSGLYILRRAANDVGSGDQG